MDTEDQPILHRLTTQDSELAGFEWNPESRDHGPTLLFAHGTGFHARCWDSVIAQLPGLHAMAVDMRGHGRSESIAIGEWTDLGKDLFDWIEAFELQDVFGIGHSAGGHAMVQAAAKAGKRISGLVLVDPVIGDPAHYPSDPVEPNRESSVENHPVVNRRNHFESPQAMFERFSDRIPYSRFDQQVLRDYCEYGLLKSTSGGFELACRPSIEACFYTLGRGSQKVFNDISRVYAPVLVIRAQEPELDVEEYNMAWSPTWPGLADLFPNGREIHFPEATHFIPLEDPELVAELISEALG